MLIPPVAAPGGAGDLFLLPFAKLALGYRPNPMRKCFMGGKVVVMGLKVLTTPYFFPTF